MDYPELPQPPLPPLPSAGMEVSGNILGLANAVELSLAQAVISLREFETARTELAALKPQMWFQDEPDVYASLEPVRRTLAARQPRPSIYYDAAPRLHAQTFVLLLRMIGLYLEKIAEEAGPAYPVLEQLAKNFEASFPGLKDLRNSITHAEDRLRHLDQKHRAIIPQAVPGITEGDGVFLSGLLKDRSLGWTLGDGNYAECEVSERALAIATRHAEEMMDALAEPESFLMPKARYHPPLA
jgi:hypothetical protein